MNKTVLAVVILFVLIVLAVFGYKAYYKPNEPVMENPQVIANPTPIPSSAELKQQLILTEDAGGAADFSALSEEMVGL